MNKTSFIAGSALVISAAGLVEAVDEPRFCDMHEVSLPFPYPKAMNLSATDPAARSDLHGRLPLRR